MTDSCIYDFKHHIPAKEVKRLCGSISDMTLWRWLRHEDLKFPKPIYINALRYWRRGDIDQWLANRRVESKAPLPPQRAHNPNQEGLYNKEKMEVA